MTSRGLSGILIIALSLVFCMPMEAQTPELCCSGPSKPIVSTKAIVGVLVGAIVVGVVITVLIVHYSKKRAVTGCVSAGASGMTVIDEKDKHVYALSGNTAGITPGNRVKLQGNKIKLKSPGDARIWVATKVSKDFGVCQP
jgi:hypothetical protein